MTQDEARARNVEYLMLNAEQSLESAKAEAAAGRYRFAMNRVYYACFYAASAVLVNRGCHFVKHAGLRAAVHRDLVKTGDVSPEMGASSMRSSKTARTRTTARSWSSILTPYRPGSGRLPSLWPR